jgi:hypothetical protein
VGYNLNTILPQLDTRTVSGSAFTQARYKIRPEFFKYLGQVVVKHYQQIEKKLWKGHRLIGIDGSTLNLPPTKEIIEHFGTAAQTEMGVNRCLARVSLFYDLLNDFTVESEVSPMGEGEKTHLFNGIKRITGQNDIYILDRGYGHYNTVLKLIQCNKQFCIRFSNCSNVISNFIKGDEDDLVTDWIPSKKEKENARKQGLTPVPIKVGLTKIKLKTGEDEVLVSSLLDMRKYSYSDLKWLYQKRWIVEEGFKKLKPKMKVEYFGARKTAGIYQEYYAHIFLMNVISFLSIISNKKETRKYKNRKYQYKVNWQNTYRLVRTNLLNILSKLFHETHLEKLIEKIVFSVIPIIPDKTFTRDMRHASNKGRIHHYYK